MKVSAVSSIHRITFSESDSLKFKKLFPSSRDIEAFNEEIEEEGVHLSFYTEAEEVTVEVEVDHGSFPFYGDTRAEAYRIAGVLKDRLNNE